MSAFFFTLTLSGFVGLLLGSFLNVCIVRLPRGESIVQPRSHCPVCGHPVRAFDNVPVLSFLLLRGRCRDCGARIAWHYPAIEIATALWFAFSFLPAARALTASSDVDAVLLAFVHGSAIALFGFLLIGLAVMDWQTGLLPNEFTIGGLCAGLFFAGAESFWVPSVRYKTFFTPEEVFFGRRLGAAAAAFLLMWLIATWYRLIRKRQGMGMGDAKMLAMIGAFLGFGLTGLAFFVGVVLAGVAGIALLAVKRGSGTTRLPFGSFLAIGGLFSAAFGDRILDWYLALFR